jgi:hypothetical protein
LRRPTEKRHLSTIVPMPWASRTRTDLALDKHESRPRSKPASFRGNDEGRIPTLYGRYRLTICRSAGISWTSLSLPHWTSAIIFWPRESDGRHAAETDGQQMRLNLGCSDQRRCIPKAKIIAAHDAVVNVPNAVACERLSNGCYGIQYVPLGWATARN